MLIALYSDIIKHADINLDEKIKSKAIVLNRQRIKPRLIKVNLLFILFYYFIYLFLEFWFKSLSYSNTSNEY